MTSPPLDYAKLRERLRVWADNERRDGDHVRGPAFGQPWGQDIIDRHNQNADDLITVLALLAENERMAEALDELLSGLKASRNDIGVDDWIELVEQVLAPTPSTDGEG